MICTYTTGNIVIASPWNYVVENNFLYSCKCWKIIFQHLGNWFFSTYSNTSVPALWKMIFQHLGNWFSSTYSSTSAPSPWKMIFQHLGNLFSNTYNSTSAPVGARNWFSITLEYDFPSPTRVLEIIFHYIISWICNYYISCCICTNHLLIILSSLICFHIFLQTVIQHGKEMEVSHGTWSTRPKRKTHFF